MTESNPIVAVHEGKIRGRTGLDYNGKIFYIFHGIPYAKPPIGILRFKDPLPAENWDGIRDATIEGSECYSKHMITNLVCGSEDCLNLNVYTPELPDRTKSSLKPVMVWIHGGGFVTGSNKTELYGPEFLIAEDVVLVTINYRLGFLGFLSFDDSSLGATGNAGLKDMVMALKWVKKNIDKFNGNPKNVTIFGESAGSAAVHLLILSPMAAGLFHKAILQSGCALNSWTRGKKSSKLLAEAAGIKTNDEKIIFEELQKMSIKDLYRASRKIKDDTAIGNFRAFLPIVEKPSKNAFLTEEPLEIIKSGKYNKVPMIIGFNSLEGIFVLSKIKNDNLSNEFLVPNNMGLNKGTPLYNNVAGKIRKFYFGNEKPTVRDIYRLLTDNYFFIDIYGITRLHVKYNCDLPVYFYRFSLNTDLNMSKILLQSKEEGASHADDLGYLFRNDFLPKPVPNSPEDLAVKKMTKLWTNFAKNTNPTPKENILLDKVMWRPVSKENFWFLEISDKLTMDKNLKKETVEFWDELRKIENKISKL